MRKYMVVEHHVSNEQLKTVGNVIIGQIPIHSMLQNYHWARMDDTHVILIGSYFVSNHVALHNHPLVSILPAENSTKTIENHHMKQAHKDALQKSLSLESTHTMEHVMEKLELQFGPTFANNK